MKYILSCNLNDTEYKTIVNIRKDCGYDRLFAKCATAMNFYLAEKGILLLTQYVDYSVPDKKRKTGSCCIIGSRFPGYSQVNIRIQEYNGKVLAL